MSWSVPSGRSQRFAWPSGKAAILSFIRTLYIRSRQSPGPGPFLASPFSRLFRSPCKLSTSLPCVRSSSPSPRTPSFVSVLASCEPNLLESSNRNVQTLVSHPCAFSHASAKKGTKPPARRFSRSLVVYLCVHQRSSCPAYLSVSSRVTVLVR